MEPSDRVYILHILDAIGEIETYVAGMGWEDFLKDSKTQSAIVRQLEIIGEASKHLSESYRRSTPLPWKDIAGMREKLIHHYFDVDLETVWITATKDLAGLKNAINGNDLFLISEKTLIRRSSEAAQLHADGKDISSIPLKLILSGLPGSGKDTQAARLSERLGIPSFSMGDVLRDEIARGTETGRLVTPFVERGEIIPAGVAGRLMRDRLENPSVQKSGYVCNGYPRSVESFRQYLDWEWPTAVIVLDVPRELAAARLDARGRHDDTADVIGARFRAYDEVNLPLYDWLATTGIWVVHVDGTGTVDMIAEKILGTIEK